jgi:hypothetical protein
LLLASLAARPAFAQGAALRVRSDSLLREWRQANALAGLQDSLRLAVRLAGRDTIRVGALVIVANPSPLPLAQAAARIWPVIERYYGTAARNLSRRPFLIQAVDPDTTSAPSPGSLGMQMIPWDLDVTRLAQVLLTMADLGAVDPRLHDWLGGPLTPRFDSGPRRERVYLQLVTAPSRAVRRCFVGEIGACRDALSLSNEPDMLSRWYGADERRRLVTIDYLGFLDRGAQHALFQSCSAGSDSACLELLAALPPGSLSRPLDAEARAVLLELAVRQGGPSTFQRLLDAPDSAMGARLAAATGIPEDSLVAGWREAVLRARPTPVSLPPWGLWLALGWTMLFATCGLRSSRWRVQ